MTKLMPTDIKAEVEDVLRNKISSNRGLNPFITAYQVLERLPDATKIRLYEDRGEPGKNSGNYYAAANVVAEALQMIVGIDIKTLETGFLKLSCGGKLIEPGNQNVGLYRLIK